MSFDALVAGTGAQRGTCALLQQLAEIRAEGGVDA